MLGIITAYGVDKEEVIQRLKEAIIDLEHEAANNCLAENWEYEIFPSACHIALRRLLKETTPEMSKRKRGNK